MENNYQKKSLQIIANSKKYIAISLAAIALLLCVTIFNIASGNGAFNLDVEFSGGTAVVVDMGQDVNETEIEDFIKENSEETNPLVRKYDGGTTIEIKIQETDSTTVQNLVSGFITEFGLTEESIVSTNTFSSTVSKEMQKSAFVAMLVAFIAILIYVGLRFKDFTMGVSAIIALLHDITFVILFYSVMRIPLNYSFIAVLLTIVGYSINATIVIFDRARENKRSRPSLDDGEIMNMSINQTITRSIYTSITTLLAILFLYIFGVESMKEFSLPIVFGIAVGTYSSVFISGSVWYNLRGLKANKEAGKKDVKVNAVKKEETKKEDTKKEEAAN